MGKMAQTTFYLGDPFTNLRGICSTVLYYQFITKRSEVTFSKPRILARTSLLLKVSVPVLLKSELGLGNTMAVVERKNRLDVKHIHANEQVYIRIHTYHCALLCPTTRMCSNMHRP